MNRAWCPTCGNEVRISTGGTEMEWDAEGTTERLQGDFHKSWVCPFCYPEHFTIADSVGKK
jgi:hypothetical protein